VDSAPRFFGDSTCGAAIGAFAPAMGDRRPEAPAMGKRREAEGDSFSRARFPTIVKNGTKDSKKEEKMETVPRFLQGPAGSFFLFGPRGTGKSTWLRTAQQDAVWLDLLDPEAQQIYQARPDQRSKEENACIIRDSRIANNQWCSSRKMYSSLSSSGW
jgi:hypothetical protein